MRSHNSTRIWRPTRWAVAASILLLTACGTTPTVPDSARTQPHAAMVKPDKPPPPPKDMSQLPPQAQADMAFRLYRGMTDYAGQLEKKYDELVRWIEGEY